VEQIEAWAWAARRPVREAEGADSSEPDQDEEGGERKTIHDATLLHQLVWYTAKATTPHERTRFLQGWWRSAGALQLTVVSHLCGNPRCIHPHHLAVQTRADDALDRDKHAQMPWVSRG
jgi:hypothetical protein